METFNHWVYSRILRVGFLILVCIAAQATSFPGGIVETPTTTQVRPLLGAAQIKAMLPARGKFNFPAPYNTQAVRLTNATDCGGGDCLWYVGYSYWRNTNNHVGSDTMYVFLGLNRSLGGGGPTLFSYNKLSDAVSNLGPLFDAGSALSWSTAEGWYFSATQPTTLYLNSGSKMQRYDILSKQLQTIYDVSAKYGADKTIWQMHSSDDDKVHSATLRDASGYLGCVVYHEDTAKFQYFPKIGDFDECNLDRSGRWLITLENTQGSSYGLDMRVIDLSNGSERILLDQNGAVGHADMGYGYVIGSDNWNSMPNAILAWDFLKPTLSGTRVFYNNDWSVPAANHISHTNAKPGIAMSQQYACGSNASSTKVAWGNEIVCFRLDGSLKVLVVAPVMTDMNSAVGGDDYAKEPKGNLDVTGQYFIWTSNAGGSRIDAFIVKVPSQLITGATDTQSPSVSLGSPNNGATLTGSVTISATANDNVAVAGVQFKLDGANLATEQTTAPYSINWNTATTSSGVHTLTATARDAAGNRTTSTAIQVTLTGTTITPSISNMVASNISSSGVTITWLTNELSNTQVEYDLTSNYGSSSTLDKASVITHSVTLSALAAGTLYHYRARSRDLNGALAASLDATFTTSSTVTPTGEQDVAWTNLVNVSATGNSLKKTAGCDGCADAGSQSVQKINSGYGYVEFTVSETNLVRAIGLNNNSTGTSTAEIPFAIKLVSGFAEVREKDLYQADTPIASGDVLRISVNAGVVRYRKNGVLIYTSSAMATYPLRADTALINSAATISNVRMAGVSVAQSVTWTNHINTSVSNGVLSKTGGCSGCEDASATSQQLLTGNGYLKFPVAQTTLVRYIGLNNHNTGTRTAEIPFAFKLVSGRAEVRENDQYRADVPIIAGDVLSIHVQSGQVKYAKNGVLIYTSTVAPSYPLNVDAVMIDLNSIISNVVLTSTP